MLPRVPNAASASRAPARRWTPCKFVSGGDVAHYLAQEVVIEGVLHVSAAQAGTCLERFGDIDALPAPALPPLEDVLAAPTGAPGPAATTTTHSASSAAPVQTVHSGSTPFAVTAGALGGSSSSSPLHGGPAGLQRPSAPAASRASSATERIVSEAFCLATPPDNPGENNSPLRQPQPQPTRTAGGASAQTATSTRGGNSNSSSSFLRLQALRGSPSSSNANNSGSSSGSSLPAELEEFLQLEGTAAAYQYGAARMSAQALHANEVLRASAAVRRKRRRALIRLLRRTREKSAAGLSVLQDSTPVQLLATIGASISSLGSWDDEGPSRPGSRGSKRRISCPDCSDSGSGSDTDVEWDSRAAADSSIDE